MGRSNGMRRLLVVLLLASSVLALSPPASAAPADSLPVTVGTYSGRIDCDHGCWGDVVLQGRFTLRKTTSVVTAAHLTWQMPDTATSSTTASITSPAFSGTCTVSKELVGSVLLAPNGVATRIVKCIVDARNEWISLAFQMVDEPKLDASAPTTGRYTHPADPSYLSELVLFQ